MKNPFNSLIFATSGLGIVFAILGLSVSKVWAREKGGNSSGSGDLYAIQAVLPAYLELQRTLIDYGAKIYAPRDLAAMKRQMRNVPRIGVDPVGDGSAERLAELRASHAYGFFVQNDRPWIVVSQSEFEGANDIARLALLGRKVCEAAYLDGCETAYHKTLDVLRNYRSRVPRPSALGRAYRADRASIGAAVDETLERIESHKHEIFSGASDALDPVLRAMRGQYRLTFVIQPQGVEWAMGRNPVFVWDEMPTVRAAYSVYASDRSAPPKADVYVNTEAWDQGRHPIYQRALIHHEICVMAGLESTGDYAYTLRYLQLELAR